MQGIDTEEMPPCVLYKMVVEYLSVPPTGKQEAVLAEELSMLSFGGSLDDDVKYGALASLYDTCAKYVLEIYSVRGKKYKFDLMDATLNDGTVPQLPSSLEGDPFVKSLCVTVTNHNMAQPSDTEVLNEDGDKVLHIHDEKSGADKVSSNMDKQISRSEGEPLAKKRKKDYAVNRMHLTLEGKLRISYQELPTFDHMVNAIKASFLQLRPNSPIKVSATQSGHTLLLDSALAGRIFVNGRYITHWGNDPRIGSNAVALFGMDLHNILVRNGQIVDFEEMKIAYAELWHELLVDAKLINMDLAKRLLYRMLIGYDTEDKADDCNEYGYDDDVDTDSDCLESQIFSSPKYDRVGIAAKALATRFSAEFGKKAFACLEYEVDWVTSVLPGRQPVIVPVRLLNVLRRGGHGDVQKTHDECFFASTRPPREGGEKDIVAMAVDLVVSSGCEDIEPDQVVIAVSPGVSNAIQQKAVCRYANDQQLFVIQESFLSDDVHGQLDDGTNGINQMKRRKAFLLGFYLAAEHPDGETLVKYILRNNV